MANTSIGTAWIQIKPTTSGLKSATEKELDSELTPVAQQAGEDAGNHYGKNFVDNLKSVIGLTAIGNFLKDSVNVGMEFGSSMSQVAATLGYSVAELHDESSEAAQTMSRLSDFAEEMGATTAFTARESAQALNYMALAGYDAEQSMEMLPNVLNLAAAGGMDLARASDMVTDAQTALGLSFDETNQLVDKMARAASRSNTSVSQLGEAILQIGGTAKILKGGTTELSTALGILADNGIKSAEGGTQLRNILQRLTNPTRSGAATMDDLGVSVFDAEGNMRSLQDVFVDMSEAMTDFTQEERAEALGRMFNVRDLKAAEALLGTNVERWEELGAAIDDSAGAADEMAKVQLDNLQGDVTLLGSAFEGFQITLEKTLEPILRPIIEAITGFFTFLQENEWAMDMLLGVIAAIALALIGSLVPAIWATTTAMLANPITWIILLVGALIGGIILLISHLDEVGKFFQEVFDVIGKVVEDTINDLLKFFGDLWQGVKDILNKIGQFFTDFWNDLVNLVVMIGNYIGETVSGAFKAVVNGVLAFIENFINAPIKLLNGFIGMINNAFGFIGVNLGTIALVQLPRLATGGVVGGIGTATSDSNIVALSKGEYVIRAAAAQEIGYNNLDRMNETGEATGERARPVQIIINGYNKSPDELANIVSRKIALKTQGVY